MTELAVVVGASGGIGRAMAETLRQGGARVAAVSRRRPDGWPGRDWIPADVLDESSLASAAARLVEAGAPTRIVVASGLLHGPGVAPEKTMRTMSLESLATLFAVNAAGPALVAKHFLPLTPRDRRSIFAVLSARVGSIGDNRLGGWYAYRASKAALNMLIRTLAVEHRRTRPFGICVALHPGTVDTALSAPFQSGVPDGKLLSPGQAAEALLAVIDALGPEANGGFYARDATPLPW
nr:SDR family NAD(P)-dependent oxidoreductase [uncultured Rhodopila sp.]